MGFGHRIQHLVDTNGRKFAVTYLKECVRLVQKFISGSPEFLSQGIPVDLAGGLPRIIPGPLRSRMRRWDPGAYRVSLTLLSAFRVFSIPGQLKLSTITDPFKGLSSTLPLYEVELGLKMLDLKLPSLEGLRSVSLVYSGSAGPNNRSSVLGIMDDIRA
jgi:hypothetical protein